MKKIILTSAGFENKAIERVFLGLLGKEVVSARALWIPTAAIFDDAKAVLPKCMDDLLNAGISKEDIVVYDLDHEMTYEELCEYDAVYVCGGDSEYLLEQMKQQRFLDILARYVEERGVYIGVSAGSCICANAFDEVITWLPSTLHVHCEQGSPNGTYDAASMETVSLTNDQAVVFDQNEIYIMG